MNKGMKHGLVPVLLALGLGAGCRTIQEKGMKVTFGDDIKFLRKHTEVIVLSDRAGKAQVAVSAAYQGRALTSTADGNRGTSFGWINRELIASGVNNPHINAYGGEDRFWLGPEGGQFTIFFKKGDPFDLEHWFTPPAVNEEPFDVVSKQKNSVSFRKTMRLINYSGSQFDVEVNREVRLLSASEIEQYLGVKPGKGVKTAAYQSENKIANTGKEAWTKQTGLLSIWILGMLNASDTTTVAVPFEKGHEDKLGPVVNDAYFGKVPSDRLVVKDGILYFKGDAKCRSKIGLTPKRAKSILGSYDAASRTLTLAQYNKPAGVTDYVNSMWRIQEQPFAGDTVNSYNDGPPAPGAKQLGSFYELETSSPAAELKPGRSITHVHRTFHFQGSPEELDVIARASLDVTVGEIQSSLK